MSGYVPGTTPVMTEHARQRCLEMGISTKVPKQIVRRANLVRPDKPGSARCVMQSSKHPGYVAVVEEVEASEPPAYVVITVMFNDPGFKARKGVTYERWEA